MALAVLLGLACLLAALPARADGESGFVACRTAMTAAQVRSLFTALEQVSGQDGCRLEDVRTRGPATRITWRRRGVVLPPVRIAPSGCVSEPVFRGSVLDLAVPESVRASCPAAYARLRALVAKRAEPLEPLVHDGLYSVRWTVELTVCVFALALLWAVWLAACALRRRTGPDAETRRWLGIAAAGLVLALALRFAVQPALANWYTLVLPPSGALDGRFGPGGLVLQRVLSALLPWTDTTLFAANVVIGALAVPIALAIARERRLPVLAGAALMLLFALAPLHVRISASPSEHVLSSTLTLAALWAWLRATRLRSASHAILAVLLMAAVVLTRVEAWVQLAALLVWGVWRDDEEQVPAGAWCWRATALLGVAWLGIGVTCYFAVVLPSQHPGPELAGIRQAANNLVEQYVDVAFTSPHWVSPLALLLTLPGLGYLLHRRRRLLGGILLFLALAFVPLGRTLQHDGLLGARYFLATIPLFLILSAYGLAMCVWGIAWLGGRLPWLVGGPRWVWGMPALVLLGAGFGDLALAAPAYRARYTFQDEYDFLRGALAKVPDGCSVVSLPIRSPRYDRDMDCCLNLAVSPLSLVYPRLHLGTVKDAEALGAPGCRYYYESAACSIEDTSEVRLRDPGALDFFTRECRRALGPDLVLEAQREVSPRSTNGFFDHHPPRVRLFRVETPRHPAPGPQPALPGSAPQR